jgi:hypothetical protein
MTTVCIGCGFTSDEVDAKFCPNCGGTLEPMVTPQAVPASTALPGCPKCGSRANSAGARFCQQCGANLAGQQVAGQVYPVGTGAPVYPVNVKPVGAPSSGAKVTGMKVRSMPIARMTENGQEQPGSVELHTDGILFFKARVLLSSLHVSDIAKASPGAKNNLLDVQMKDGSTKSFKFMNASEWAGIINQNIK